MLHAHEIIQYIMYLRLKLKLCQNQKISMICFGILTLNRNVADQE